MCQAKSGSMRPDGDGDGDGDRDGSDDSPPVGAHLATGADPDDVPTTGESLTKWRIPRRRFLIAAGVGAVALAAAGYGIDDWITSGPPAPLFHSHPDLAPATVSVAVPAGGTAPGYLFLTPAAGPDQYGPMIVDNFGQLVWFRQIVPAPMQVATNLEVQQLDGEPVLTWWEGTILIPEGYGRGAYVIADTSYREITRVYAGNGLSGDLHEFTLTPEGTALFTVYRSQNADLSAIGGPKQGTLLNSLLQEVDVKTGQVLFEWDPLQHISLDESYQPASAIPANGNQYDWLHLNSIDVDTDGNLLISARHTWAVYKIDRKTGDVIWRLNGKRSDFEVGLGVAFEYQHCARRAPDGTLTLFDDGSAPPQVAPRSRGINLSLDETTMRAELVHEYFPDPIVTSASQGSVQNLSNGNVLVGWGSAPSVSEYTSDGRLLFDLALAEGVISYRAFRFPWVGRPEGRPAIAAHGGDNGQVIVYASWNGATEVVAWQVMAGPTGSSLSPVAVVPKQGFETTATVTTGHPAVAVAALDQGHQVLGTSATVTV